jgi:hypothetical protein
MTIRDMKARAELKVNVTAAELALLTGFSADTIRRAGRAGEIPTLTLRTGMRFPREEAIRAMRRRRKLPQETQEPQQQRETADV